MGDKNVQKWNAVIIDWINCLDTTKPIKNIKELSTCNVFNTLVKDLCPEDKTVSLLDFLKKHYADFKLPDDESEFSDKDITTAASLLLHYTCIQDRRESLTSPLCNKLTTYTQKCIKNFLECFLFSDSCNDLYKIIDRVFDDYALRDAFNTPKRCVEWNSSGECTSMLNSPLSEYFKTPVSHVARFNERESLVRQLKEELANERFEKEDMQCEIKEFKDKLDKLAQQLVEKSSLISKLNESLCELQEGSSDPDSQVRLQVENMLRMELTDCQNYSKILLKEQEELRNANEIIQKKLKESENQIWSWQTKSLDMDVKHEALLEKYKSQEIELNNLRVNYNELSALLEELRANKVANTSLDVSSISNLHEQSVCETEDLACTVVEVQLREAQQQNNELNEQIKKSCEKEQELNDLLKVSSDEILILEERLRKSAEEVADLANTKIQLLDSNNNLETQIKVLQETQESLAMNNKRIVNDLEELKLLKDEEIESLQITLDSHRNKLSESDDLIVSIKNELDIVKNEGAEFKKSLEERNRQYERLENEANRLQTSYEELLEQYTEKNFSYEAAMNSIKEFDGKFDENLKILEGLVLDVQNAPLDKFEKFSFLLQQVDATLKSNAVNEVGYLKTIEDMKCLNCNLEKEVTVLKENEVANSMEINCLKKQLVDLQSVADSLQKLVDDKCAEIQKLRNEINDLRDTVSGLEELKVSLSQSKEELHFELNNKEEDLEKLNIALMETKMKNQDLEVGLQEQMLQNKSLQEKEEDVNRLYLNVKEELKCKGELLDANELSLERIQREFEASKCENEQIVNDLNFQIIQLETQLNNTKVELQTAIEECQLKAKEKQEVTELKLQLQDQCIKITTDYNKKVELLNETISNLSSKLDDCLLEKSNIEANYESQRNKMEKLNDEKDLYINQCEALRLEVVNLSEVVKRKESECIERDDIITSNNRELLSVKLELEKARELVDELKKLSENLHKEKSDAVEEIKHLLKEKTELEHKEEHLIVELEMVKKLRDTLEENALEVKMQVENAFDQLEIKSEDLAVGLEECIALVKQRDVEVRNLNDELMVLKEAKENDLMQHFTSEKELSDKVNELTDKSEELQKELDRMKALEIEHIQEISLLKEELLDSVEKYALALEKEKEVKIENEFQINSLTESIHNMVSKYNEIDSEKESLHKELNYNKDCIESLHKEKTKLEFDLLQLKQQYENDLKVCAEEYSSEFENLSHLENRLYGTIKALQRTVSIDETSDKKEILLNELEDAENQLQSIVQEKSGLEQKQEMLLVEREKLRKEFANFKISEQLSKYMNANKVSLERNFTSLEETLHNLLKYKQQKKEAIDDLKKDLKSTVELLKSHENEFFELKKCRDDELIEFQQKFTAYQKNIDELYMENDGLRKQIAADTEKYDYLLVDCSRKDSKVTELCMQIAKLQAACDILETGKANMERNQDQLKEHIEELRRANEEELCRYETTKLALEEQLGTLQETIEKQALEIEAKECEIQLANEEFEDVKVILTNMSQKMNRQLSTIHEDYDGKLLDQEKRFQNLKEHYDSVKSEITYVFAEYEKVKSELAECHVQRNSAEMMIREKEAAIFELQNKYENLVNEVSDKDTTIASLQAELEAKLGQLELDFGEKLRLEGERCAALEKLQCVEREREKMLERHAEYVRSSEEAMEVLRLEASNLLRKSKEINVLVEDKKQLQDKIDVLLEQKQEIESAYMERIQELEHQVNEATVSHSKLKEGIIKLTGVVLQTEIVDVDEENFDEIISKMEKSICDVFEKLGILNEAMSKTQVERDDIEKKYAELSSCYKQLTSDKERLLENYERLHREKLDLAQDNDKQLKCLENLKMQYEQSKNNNDLKILNTELESKLESLKEQNASRHQIYQQFLSNSKAAFKDIEDLISKRNSLDHLIYLLKDKHVHLLIKSSFVNEDSHKLLHEQKVALGVIIDDIHKQFNRLSKMAYASNIACCQNFEKIVNCIMTDKPIDLDEALNDKSIEELYEKLDDLKDNTTGTLEQLDAFDKSLEVLSKDSATKSSKILKENVQQSGTEVIVKAKEEDWKKKYMATKQRLTLVENAKNNFERKIKELREEKRCLTNGQNDATVDHLLQYNILKEQHEKFVLESEAKYQKLVAEFEKGKLVIKKDPQVDAERLELAKQLDNLREAYAEAKFELTQLKIDNASLTKILAEKNDQVIALATAKESFERLFEENNKLKSEIDTLKFKRTKDREEYVRHIKGKEKKNNEIKAEYEMKLEKMKNKMITTFKEEVGKNEVQNIDKIASIKDENRHYKDTIVRLRNEIDEIKTKNLLLESEKAIALQELKVYQRLDQEKGAFCGKEVRSMSRQQSSQSLENGRLSTVEERRYSTMPRRLEGSTIVEELRIQKLTSITGNHDDVEMEDDMFNNKYLADLKEGRSSISHQDDPTRLSVLAYRNSLCPPHLKSSYPLETQFVNHRQFRDEDLKNGKVDFDESLRTRLLPNEVKPKKKDIGTTSYKRPGPPTPSKHGGRPSLSQELPDFPRDMQRDSLEPKQRTTPNRLKSLFSHHSSKESSEGSQQSPRKRFSFFRKPR